MPTTKNKTTPKKSITFTQEQKDLVLDTLKTEAAKLRAGRDTFRSKKKTAPKKTTKTQRAPLLLAAIASMVGERCTDADLLEALTAARKGIAEYGEGNYADSISEYVDRFATSDVYRKDVQTAEAAGLDVFGSLHNAFATPGILAGMAIAYLVLTNDGGTR